MIINENSKWFTLAYSSLLLKPKILNQIGHCIEKLAAENLIFNNIPLTGLDPDLYQFLSLLYNSSIFSISNHISVQQWNAYWNQSREATLSSMSGIHFGYYKVQTKSCFLATIRYQLINMAIRNRSPLARWLNGLLVMLEKSKGNI